LPAPATKISSLVVPVRILSFAAGIGGFVIIGESAGDYSGYSVSNAGDVNGDGLDDLIVGAHVANPGGRTSAGKSYVIFGKTDTNAIYLSKLGDESKYTIDYLGDKNDNILTGTMSWMRLSLILVKSRVKPAPSNLRVSIPPPPSTRAQMLLVLVIQPLIKLLMVSLMMFTLMVMPI
jgi:hypothetical protein